MAMCCSCKSKENEITEFVNIQEKMEEEVVLEESMLLLPVIWVPEDPPQLDGSLEIGELSPLNKGNDTEPQEPELAGSLLQDETCINGDEMHTQEIEKKKSFLG